MSKEREKRNKKVIYKKKKKMGEVVVEKSVNKDNIVYNKPVSTISNYHRFLPYISGDFFKMLMGNGGI